MAGSRPKKKAESGLVRGGLWFSWIDLDSQTERGAKYIRQDAQTRNRKRAGIVFSIYGDLKAARLLLHRHPCEAAHPENLGVSY